MECALVTKAPITGGRGCAGRWRTPACAFQSESGWQRKCLQGSGTATGTKPSLAHLTVLATAEEVAVRDAGWIFHRTGESICSTCL